MARKEEAPGAGTPEASDNDETGQESNVMSNATAISVERNVQAATAQVVPFRFETKEVRTVIIDDQLWFVAKDIIGSLGYAKSSSPAKLTDHVPKQWKGVNPIHTLGGLQRLLMLSEQGLYFFLGRSDKPKALPIQIWVAGEVLPAIRKHGRYEDDGRMATLMDELIGMTELGVIKGVIRDKVQAVPAERRHGFQLAMHNRLHTRFNVSRTAMIPASQFEAACNFVAAYAIEGEWLPKEKQVSTVGPCEWSSVGVLINCIEQCWRIMERSRLSHHLSSLGCKTGIEISSFLYDALGSAAHVKKRCANELDWRKQA